MRSGGDGRRSVAVALLSTVVFFVVVAVAITHAPGWPEVRSQFFDWGQFKATFPEVARAFLLNVKIFCIAEAIILAVALFLAVLRSLPGPVFFPIRALADGLEYAFDPRTVGSGFNAQDLRTLAIWTAVGVFMMLRFLRQPQGEAAGPSIKRLALGSRWTRT